MEVPVPGHSGQRWLSVLVAVQLRSLGHISMEAQAWFTGAGVYGVLGVCKDAWDRKFPYAMLLAPAQGMCWAAQRVTQGLSLRPVHCAVAMALATLLGGVAMGVTLLMLRARVLDNLQPPL